MRISLFPRYPAGYLPGLRGYPRPVRSVYLRNLILKSQINSERCIRGSKDRILTMKKNNIVILSILLLIIPLQLSRLVLAADQSLKLEAEDGNLIGTSVANAIPGYSGKGYVTGFEKDGDSVVVKVNVPEEGFYPLYIGYAAPSGDKGNRIVVNGKGVGSKMFPKTASFQELEFGKINLHAGENTIAFVKEWGWMEVDYFRIGPKVELKPVGAISPTLVTNNPIPEAKALMAYLASNYGKQIIAGQQSGAMNEKDFIYSLTGKLPVIYGFDFLNGLDYEVRNAKKWAEQGGIVAFSWHWRAPKDGNDFYTNKTKFDVTKAVTPGTEEYELTLKDIDAVAASLKQLQEAKIPVLWRPLHEAEGGWFWWGAKGAEPCMKLYRLLFDRLNNYHQLRNLIWVWTDSASTKANDWYPGNEYVDIVGFDSYPPEQDYNPLLIQFYELVNRTGGKKLVAITENGPIPDPDELQKYHVGWSFFVTWSGWFVTGERSNTFAHFRKVYTHPYVITLDEFPAAQIYGKPLSPIPPAKPLPTAAPIPVGFKLYEAEDGKLIETRIDTSIKGYSGKGAVDSFNQDSSAVEITVVVPKSGDYPVMLRYASIFENHPNAVYVNGQFLGELKFYHTPIYRDCSLGNIKLNAGANILKIKKTTGYIWIDAVLVGELKAIPILSELAIVYKNRLINFDNTPPIIVEKTKVLAQCWELTNYLGAEMYWNKKENTVTIKKGQIRLELIIDKKTAGLNGKTVNIDIKPIIKDGKVFVPVMFVAKALGNKVSWDKNCNYIDIE